MVTAIKEEIPPSPSNQTAGRRAVVTHHFAGLLSPTVNNCNYRRLADTLPTTAEVAVTHFVRDAATCFTHTLQLLKSAGGSECHFVLLRLYIHYRASY